MSSLEIYLKYVKGNLKENWKIFQEDKKAACEELSGDCLYLYIEQIEKMHDDNVQFWYDQCIDRCVPEIYINEIFSSYSGRYEPCY